MSIANIEISGNKKLKKSYFFNECNNITTNFACTEELPVTTGTIWLKLEQDITTPTGRSSEPQIKILSLIVSWCQYNKAMVWRTSYSYLKKVLKRSVDAIRKNITALEKKGLIIRTIKHAMIDGKMRPNVMFLELTEKTIKLLQTVSTDNSSSRQKRKDINNTNNNIKNNRSRKSNFCKKNLSDASTSGLITHNDTTNSSDATSPIVNSTTLTDYSELSSEDCDILRKLSGRNFSNAGIMQILNALMRKCRHTVFTVKRAFLSYFAKCLRYEYRSEEQVNDINFQARVKLTGKERMQKKQEQYLTAIEQATASDMEMQFQKMVVRGFTSNRAYQILTSLKSFSAVGTKAVLTLTKAIELETNEQEKLLKIADNVYAEHYVKEHNIGFGKVIGNAFQKFYGVETDEQLVPALTELVLDINEGKNQQAISVKSGANNDDITETLTNGEEHLQLFNKFSDYFDGAVAKSWFSSKKFDVSCDHEQKQIVAKARDSFIFYHFKDHYLRYLENITNQVFSGYQFILQGAGAR